MRRGASTSTTTRTRPVRCGWSCSAITLTTKPPTSARSASRCCRTSSGTTLIDRLPKALKRALVLLGASDTGKSILLRVLSGLTDGQADLDAAVGDHPARTVWRNSCAARRGCSTRRSTSASGISATTSRRSSPGSRSSINPKNHPLLTMRINAPALWGTNHPPTFKENTEAMVNRLLIVQLTRVFDKDEFVGVAAKAKAVNPAWEPSDLILAREKAGVLNWMLIGLQRVLKRGNFVNTAEGVRRARRHEAGRQPGRRLHSRLHRLRRQRDDVDGGLLCRLHRLARGNARRRESQRSARIFVGKNLAALSHPRIGQDKNASGRRTAGATTWASP